MIHEINFLFVFISVDGVCLFSRNFLYESNLILLIDLK